MRASFISSSVLRVAGSSRTTPAWGDEVKIKSMPSSLEVVVHLVGPQIVATVYSGEELQLLATLTEVGTPWAIATSGWIESARPMLEQLGVPAGVPVITRDQVEHAKPDPDLFLAAAERLRVPIDSAIVVGDSVWDLLAARRARALGVGLLSGGYGQEELERAGAYRVYEDPADLLHHIDELGIRER